MKIKIFISHFSLPESHFGSYDKMMGDLEKLGRHKTQFDYPDSSCVVDSNLFDLNYYGLTLKQQIDNLCNNDPMIYGTVLNIVYSKYFANHDFVSLRDEAGEWQSSNELCKCYAYTPSLEFNNMESISGIKSFLVHYDDILGKFPVSTEAYFNKAVARYKNLVFHEDCLSSMNDFDGDFCNFTISFTRCLSALDSISPTSEYDPNANISYIKTLTPYDCTSEGCSRPELSFKFKSGELDEYGAPLFIKLNCEFHLKPFDSNNPGDSRFYQNRVYFGFLPKGDKRLIAVASVGPHL